jgi:hypothetical protein
LTSLRDFNSQLSKDSIFSQLKNKKSMHYAGETSILKDLVNKHYERPAFMFAADDGGHDMETKQVIINGLKLEKFDVFYG